MTGLYVPSFRTTLSSCTVTLCRIVRIILTSLQLARLKRSYEKLQKKQLKEARENAKSQGHGQDQSEVTRLTKKIEVSA